MSMSPFMQRIDLLARERGLDREVVIDQLEKALIAASEKRFGAVDDFTLTIDRQTGEIRAFEGETPVQLPDLGRIVANVAKQVLVQGLRETERDIVHDEFKPREHTVLSGTIVREERGMMIVQLTGRAEAILPREEQIPGEVYRPGAVIRAYALRIEKKGSRVRIVLSRTHSAFVKELFKAEIPEVADGLIEIKGIVREPGRRTKIAVHSTDPRIDPVGSCVGMRGSRITKVTDELGGEKIDIIPWAEDAAQYIENSLKPARILKISYDAFRERARVIVSEDQLPLAIGKAGQNVRLSARLTRYKIDVMGEAENQKARAEGAEQLQRLVDAKLIDDFQREQFLDNHLDDLAVIAAQTPERIAEHLEEVHLDAAALGRLIEQANAMLTPEQAAERDTIIAARAEAERRAREDEERQLAEAAAAATAEMTGEAGAKA